MNSVTPTNPLVSVMVPVYNGEKEIALSLKSLFLQTYTNWECIIVDDGSTDNTLDEVKKFQDSRIKIFSFEKNKGRPFARQKALNESVGKYIAMLDSDDWYYPQKLELQVKYLENNNDCVLISTGMALTAKNGILDIIQGGGNGEIVTYHFHNFINYQPVPHGASMMRTLNAKKVEYDLKLQIGQDHDFMIRLLKGQKYAMIKEVLYVYNLGDSITLKKYIQGQKAVILMWSKHIKNIGALAFFKKKCSGYLKIFFAVFLNYIGFFSFLISRRGLVPTENEEFKFNRIKTLLTNFNLNE